ncbi:NACHT, LRR and PYD domains-containing protein 3-like isoform X3 [Brachyhypopomus gauderio]|uniref:NACHT, LRR and PYD domains-containing protein 3-like isoform X3 n=1 Tax=Brachyhypopomus gauderio TaxID=698409 RepID=UPI0040420F2A
MMEPHYSSSGAGTSDPKTETQRSASPVPSCVFMKSDRSMTEPLAFSSGSTPSDLRTETQRAASPVPSCVSVKSDRSMEETLTFSRGYTPSDLRQDFTDDAFSYTPVDADLLHRVSQRHKTSMKNKYESLYEGIKTSENKTHLDTFYTELYITEGDSERVNEEHEVIKMEKNPRKHRKKDTQINCSDIFKHVQSPERETEEAKIRVVLTKGICGIGKTVSVQKFILDWAEGKANQDVDFMFLFPFRQLNLIKDNHYSFYELLCDLYHEIKDLDPEKFYSCKAVFIFDGLDESRISLNLLSEKVSNITMTSSVGVLMTNLIRGELLPSALIWITSRPAAANQIPPQYVNRMTEIQGFNDPQKEEYFRKKISDQDQAEKIISHIRTARSLHIMCHIPVFCWISATVLQQIMKQTKQTEIPKTLTEMYSHFLCIQTHMMNEKYDMKSETDEIKLLQSHRSLIVKLAELAFKQLRKGNAMFYEDDLRECGIDASDTSVYSGMCTEIFGEESVLFQRKVYCFVHLSFQEFLAAFYLFHCYVIKNLVHVKSFIPPHWEKYTRSSPNVWTKDNKLHDLLVFVVDEAVKSENGHLDLFLRFLLGISLESNQRLLRGLLSYTLTSLESINMTVKYIIKQIKTKDLPTERSINLFLCLTEMRDMSLSIEIQEYLNSEKQSENWFSPAHCSAIAYMLQISEEVLDKMELKKFNTSEEGYRRLLPLIAKCRKALLADCNLTSRLSETIYNALTSENSQLNELDLSNNDFQDLGVKKLSDGLKISHCKLEILRLAGCNLTPVCSEHLSSALESENSRLRELVLSHIDFQDSGVEKLTTALKSSHCKLEKLGLANCNLTIKSSESLYSVFTSENNLRDLDISNNDLQDSGVAKLSSALTNPHCKLESLRISVCNIGNILALSLKQLANSSLKELDLSYNKLHDSGVKLLYSELKCSQLERLRLSGCLITKEGCKFLASVLSSYDSYLKELDLNYNQPGDLGVKLLSDPNCKLHTLRLASCHLNDKTCEILGSALKQETSPLRELDLSDNEIQDSGVKLLCGGLQSSHCKLEIISRKHLLVFGNERRVTEDHRARGQDEVTQCISYCCRKNSRLSGCMITEEGCSSLASALDSNPSHLKELDLTYNHPGESGVKLLSARLKDTHSNLRMKYAGKIRINPGPRKYACELTLDPDTAHASLSLTEGNRKVTCVERKSYPDYPERFDTLQQVLCRESLCGHCYWEAEWTGERAAIAVTYKGIQRKGGGRHSGFGRNIKSWMLYSSHNRFCVWHNETCTAISAPSSRSNRVGVYLDWPAGILSFYSVSSHTPTLTLLHTFHSTFTEPLYAGFWICDCESSVCLYKIE